KIQAKSDSHEKDPKKMKTALHSQVTSFDKSGLNPTETVVKSVGPMPATGTGASGTGAGADITDYFDDSKVLEQKLDILADLIRKAKHVIVYTGAGVSTSAKIPDYRSKGGVWTLQDKAGIQCNSDLTLEEARPTPTHMAIAELVKIGKVAMVVSTNI